MKKYAVFPSYIFSVVDGDRHFISAQQIIESHKVNSSECIIVPYNDVDKRALRGCNESKLKFLYPK